MGNVIRFSEATSIALHACLLLSAPGAGRMTCGELASRIGASEAHLSKVVQHLTRAGILRSKSGPGGGVELAADPSRLKLLDVYEAMEGKSSKGGCPLGKDLCPFGRRCMFGGLMDQVEDQVMDFLKRTTLGDFWKGERQFVD
jgi:Rrf2 family protein